MSRQPRRAVVLVGGPAAPYSRGLRVARSLAAEGYQVEIAAMAAEGVPAEERVGDILIRRYRPAGPFARLAKAHVVAVASPTGVAEPAVPRAPRRARSLGPLRGLVRLARRVRGWLLWPLPERGWWAGVTRDLAPADLYHACGILTIAPALRAAGAAGRGDRRPVVIYDVVDNALEGNGVVGMPSVIRRYHVARERRWARAADARLTVNDALAARLAARWDVRPPTVVPNWPEPSPHAAGDRSDRIREVLGLPPEVRIVLFQGRLSANLGLDEAAEAVLRVDHAAFVLLGFASWLERSRERDRDPRFAGRHFTLPAVHPDVLAAWTASADVSLVALPTVSRNQRDSTPNKFWESLLVGTPVVVGPGLDVMARIVREADAGVVAASLEPDALAAAIRSVLDVDPATADARRRRIAAFAAERYTWPRAAEAYLGVVRSIAPAIAPEA